MEVVGSLWRTVFGYRGRTWRQRIAFGSCLMNDSEKANLITDQSSESDGIARGRHVFKVFVAVFIMSMVILGGLVWYTWHSYGQFRADQVRNFRTVELTGVITHLDEVLTMSARMAAASGDLKWEKRYWVYEPQLGEAINEAMRLWPEVFVSEAVSQTNLANVKLVHMEEKAFDAVRRDDLDGATELLYSKDYEKEKDIYSNGMLQVMNSMRERVEGEVARQKRAATITIAVLSVFLVLTLGIWLHALRILRRHVNYPISAAESL